MFDPLHVLKAAYCMKQNDSFQAVIHVHSHCPHFVLVTGGSCIEQSNTLTEHLLSTTQYIERTTFKCNTTSRYIIWVTS